MANHDVAIWGIHAGRTGDADSLFLKHHYIALGWHRMGNLASIPAEREAFKAKVAQAYPENKPGATPVEAGQLYRFVHEMKPGDLVVYPSKQDRQVHIGRVAGLYEYNPQREPGYPNLRKVEWLRTLARTHFTQGALYEIGSAMSLFQVKNFADEFWQALEGKAPTAIPAEDETVEVVTEDIEETTRDFVVKRLVQTFKGHPLAHFVAHLLGTMGYRTRVSPPGADGGVDIVAYRDELGLLPPIIKVQVKSGEGSVGSPEVQALYGVLAPGEYGLFITVATFSHAAKNFANGKSNLRLIDGADLVNLILEHYEDFAPRYKTQLPLKRVYVPVAAEPEE